MAKYSYDKLIHAGDHLLTYWTKGGYSREDDTREVYYIEAETWQGHTIYVEVDADDDRAFSEPKVAEVIEKFRAETLRSYEEFMATHLPALEESYSTKARERDLKWSWYTEVVSPTAPSLTCHDSHEKAEAEADRIWSELNESGEDLGSVRVSAGIRLYDEQGKVPLYETIRTHMVRK